MSLRGLELVAIFAAGLAIGIAMAISTLKFMIEVASP